MSYLPVQVDSFRGVLHFQDKNQHAHCTEQASVGVSWESCTSTKGLPLHPHNKDVYVVYIISKAGGLIYSLDNQKPPAEAQLLCKYPPSFVLEEGDRGAMVKLCWVYMFTVSFALLLNLSISWPSAIWLRH